MASTRILPHPADRPVGETTGRRSAGRRIGLALVALIAVGASACSDDDQTTASDSASGTTQVGVTTVEQTDTSHDTTDPSDRVPDEDYPKVDPGPAPAEPEVVPTGAPDLTTSVYWIRPAGGEARSVPGYTDPAGPPTPALVYGSVTNNGRDPVANPRASALWKRSDGEVALLSGASIVHPDGTPVAVLEPGQSADVWAIVSAAHRDTLGDLVPEFVVEAR